MANGKSRTKRVTLTNVAAEAGVSIITASRVFDPKWEDRIRPGTRKRVLEAAEKLGYHGTNALARALQGNRTNIIALVVGSFFSYHYQEVTSCFIHELQAVGKQVLVFEVSPTNDLATIYSQVHQYCVDAIIITAPATSAMNMATFIDADIPILIYGREVKDSNLSVICCDEYTAAAKAAAALMQCGHRTFGIISGNQNASTATSRIEGFRDKIRELGGEITYIVDGDYTYESGAVCMRKLLETTRPDVIYCAEDTIAMGAMDVARDEFHLRIPEDLSVMGFDNTSVCSMKAYDLSSVSYPIETMVRSSVNAIEKLIENPSLQIERVFDMSLVFRGSVKYPGTAPLV